MFRMIHPARIAVLNGQPARAGHYVLYWMQQAQRVSQNHALEYAIEQANLLKLPVVIGFGLMDDYPDANLRHYAFMLQGLKATKHAATQRGICMVIRRGNPPTIAADLAREAAIVVCDRGYLLHQRRWRDQLADALPVRLVQIESDVVVPVEQASQKAEYAARTIRPKIAKLIKGHLVPLEQQTPIRDSLSLNIKDDLDISDIEGALAELKLDRSVPPSRRFVGGTDQAQGLLAEFLKKTLRGYATIRNEPSESICSHLSPYLHFGQISPLEIALAVMNADVPDLDKTAFLEQLIIRRELSCNYVQFTPQYWTYDALPAWARRSLENHAKDRREALYTREQLESAQTTDPYWNAAMREMIHTGYMHNYMRMYWGKCVIGWKRHPREAFDDLLYLNNRYLLDGRDANGYAGVGWCFGLHDRPWTNRPIFGQIRYMNAAGLRRKFDMEAYVKQVDQWSR